MIRRLAALALVLAVQGCALLPDPTRAQCRVWEDNKPLITTALDIAGVVPELGEVAAGLDEIETNYLEPACARVDGVDPAWVKTNTDGAVARARTILAKAQTKATPP